MSPKHRLFSTLLAIIFVLELLLALPGGSAEPDTLYRSDRFIFRSKNVDDLALVLLSFDRGTDGVKSYGEFFGAVFYRNNWSFLEGNDKYPYRGTDLESIQPSYFAKAEGSPVSGFRLHYDGGDFTLSVSSGPVQPLHISNDGSDLKKSLGVAEAVLTLRGREIWGELLHEPLVWKGFNGLKRYTGLFKEYSVFYLVTEKGKEIHFHQNKFDRQAFLNRYDFSETYQAEGGSILFNNTTLYTFKPPIPVTLLKKVTPPFAFYSIPDRWRVDAPALGTFYLWSRGRVSKNWVFGGYYLVAVEGILKGAEEERVWGLAEYIP